MVSPLAPSQSTHRSSKRELEVTEVKRPNKRQRITSYESSSSSSQSTTPRMVLLARANVTSFLPARSGKRTYFSGTSNTTVSRVNLIRNGALEETGVPMRLNCETDPRKSTPGSIDLAERIRHHAKLRIDLFYLLCVAYKGEGLTIERDTTCLQHGVGPFFGTAAAHSCILPGIKDNFFSRLTEDVKKNGLSGKNVERLVALGMHEKMADALQQLMKDAELRKIFDIVEHFSAASEGQFVSRCSNFYQSMNSTVTLPTYVNQLDSAMEKVMRPVALELVNKVSQGKLEPYEATRCFTEKIRAFYEESEAAHNKKKDLLEKVFEAEQTLLTLEVKIKNHDLRDNEGSLKLLKQYVLTARHYRALVKSFKEVSCSVSLVGRVNKRNKALLEATAVVKGFFRYGKPRLAKELDKRLRSKPGEVKDLLQQIKKFADERCIWPWDLTLLNTELDKCAAVASLQGEGSHLYPVEYLSGVMEPGTGLRPMNEQELEKQKLQIIKALPTLDYIDGDFPKESVFPKKKKENILKQ